MVTTDLEIISILFVSRDVREAWIKAKYVDKSFVKQINVELSYSNDNVNNRNKTSRKWSVRKVRRRPPKDKQPSGSMLINEESSNTLRQDVIMFGENISNRHLNTSLFDSSDEDSATSEEGI